MPRIAIIPALILLSSIAFANPCEKYVKIYATYDELENGKVVDKVSIDDLGDWSKNSTFDGLVVTKETPENAELTLEFKKKKAAKPSKSVSGTTKPFKLNNAYRVADFDILKVLEKRPTVDGSFTVRLTSGGKVLCADTKQVMVDGE